jgi:NADH-quinone oxidoreductase subunit D
MDLLETITGNRVNYSTNVLGGVKFDLTTEQIDALRQGMDFLEERTKYYLNIVTTEQTFIQRTHGIGIMPKEKAEELGAVGPTARASGVQRDVRVESPYAAYPDYPIDIVLDTAGDLEARTVVRVKELFESYRIVRAIVDNLPAGELTVRVPRRIPAGETVSRVEAPRGELFYFIKSDGTDTPARVKIYTPTLANWGAVVSLVVGHQLADVPMILAGIDPCFSCNDRAIRISPAKGDDKVWTWEQLRQHGLEHYKIRE